SGGTHQKHRTVDVCFFRLSITDNPQGHRRPRFSLSSSLVKEQIRFPKKTAPKTGILLPAPAARISKENPDRPIFGNPVMNPI
ncbi:hypothetical protein, partial [Microvirga puerhi]